MGTFHRLTVFTDGGSGAITISPSNDLGVYESGTNITLSIVADNGFTFSSWKIGSTIVDTNASFIFVMPESDVFIYAQLAGAYVPPEIYGLKYYYEWDKAGAIPYYLAIDELSYVGASTEGKISEVSYKLGNFGGSDPSDIIKTIHGSSLEFSIASDQATSLLYTDLVDSNPRKFRVRFYWDYDAITPANSTFIWQGYLVTDFFSLPEKGTNYLVSLVATDGLGQLDSDKIISTRLSSFSAIDLLSGFLKQSYTSRLNFVTNIELYEDRMDSLLGLFDQFRLAVTRFANEDDLIKISTEGENYNPYVSLKKGLELMLSPFIVRVFQWNGKWQIMRIQELLKTNIVEREYDENGALLTKTTLTNAQTVQNVFNGQRRGALAYTQFGIDFELGSLSVPEINNLVSDTFDNISWRQSGNSFYLANWIYENATIFDGVRDSEIARIERVSSPTSGQDGTFARIWGTADGATDPSISSLLYNSANGWNPQVAIENANTISFSASYQILRRGSSDPLNPPIGSHKVGFQIKIGTQYLEQVTATAFGWTSSPTIIGLDPQPSGVLHNINITAITVPEDGAVELRLYQLITVSGTRHRFIIDWDNVNLNLDENKNIVNEAIELRAITDSNHPLQPRQ
jgi:hypothetical protein